MDWMESMMAEISPATKRLHNFILPSDLRWGNRQHLDNEVTPASAAVDRRCFLSKEVSSDSLHKRKRKEKLIYDPSLVSSDFRRRSDVKKAATFAPPPPARNFKSPEYGGEGNGIEAVREKLMHDIRIAAEKLIMETPVEEQSSPEKAAAQPSVSKAENRHLPDCAEGEAKRASIRTVKGSEFDNKGKKNPRLRKNGGDGTGDEEEMAKFTATVNKSELEEDIMALTGRRPNRRPKKRPRSVKNEIDSIYPGFWLTQFNVDRYKVTEDRCRVRR